MKLLDENRFVAHGLNFTVRLYELPNILSSPSMPPIDKVYFSDSTEIVAVYAMVALDTLILLPGNRSPDFDTAYATFMEWYDAIPEPYYPKPSVN